MDPQSSTKHWTIPRELNATMCQLHGHRGEINGSSRAHNETGNSLPSLEQTPMFHHFAHRMCTVIATLSLVKGTQGLAQEPVVSDVSFVATADGSTQQYVLLFPPSFEKTVAHDVLIALHGHGSDRWQFVKDPRDECRAAREVARRHNMIFVSPDYRATTSWMGPLAEADLLQIITDLRSQYRIDQVFLCGGSMGATASLSFACMHPDLIDGVAAMNGTANLLEYENFQEAIQASFGGTKAEVPLEYKRRSAEYWPEKFSMPVAVTTSGQDTAVPPQSVARLAEILSRLGKPVLHIHREAAGHVTTFDDASAILDYVIARAGPSRRMVTGSSESRQEPRP